MPIYECRRSKHGYMGALIIKAYNVDEAIKYYKAFERGIDSIPFKISEIGNDINGVIYDDDPR